MAVWANPNPNPNPNPCPNQVTFVDGGMGYKLGRKVTDTENDLVVKVRPEGIPMLWVRVRVRVRVRVWVRVRGWVWG